MAISMGAALLGSAVIGAGASAIGASKNSKAINRATQAQNAADERALAAQQEARNQNVAMQQPFYQTGLAANNRINALLGLSPAQPTMQQSMQQGYTQFAGPSMNGSGPMFQTMGGDIPGYMGGRGIGDGMIERRYGLDGGEYAPQGWQAERFSVAPGTDLAEAQQAFSDWRDNTGYQFRFNEGIRAIDAGAPVRNSGATLKARMAYGQGLASDEYGRYFGALQDQQRVGVGAANALSGVQTNYANSASDIARSQGQTAANAAVARANNTNAMIGGITSSFGNALGMYGGLGGFGKPSVPSPTYAPAPDFTNWNGRY